VLDVRVGNKNLQQCADAIMRLRAEYLFQQQWYNAIRGLQQLTELFFLSMNGCAPSGISL